MVAKLVTEKEFLKKRTKRKVVIAKRYREELLECLMETNMINDQNATEWDEVLNPFTGEYEEDKGNSLLDAETLCLDLDGEGV